MRKSDKVKGQTEKALTLPNSVKLHRLVSMWTQQASFEDMHVDFQRSHEKLSQSRSSNIRSWSLVRKLDTDWALLAEWTPVREWAKQSYGSACLTFIHEGRSFQARNFTSVTPYPQLTKGISTSCTWKYECEAWSIVDTICVRRCPSERVVREETVALMWNKPSRPSATTSPVTHHQICTHMRLSSADSWHSRWSDRRRPSQSNSLAIAEIGLGVVQVPLRRFGHRPEFLPIG